MKKSFLLFALLLISLASNAMPARKGLMKTITLSDGTHTTAELCGDEFFSYWKAADGKCYVYNPDKQIYESNNFDELLVKSNSRRAQVNTTRASRAPRKVTIGGTHSPYIGKKKGLIILVNFTDLAFSKFHNKNFYDNIANKIGYTSSLGFVGSVKDYFLAQSNGQFELDFDIAGPYNLSHEYAYYGAHSGNSNDVRPGAMIASACQAADADVNYADYDWDGDGYVDQVYVMYAGLGEASGGDANTIWPHEFELSSSDYGHSYATNDKTADGTTIGVDRYATGSEMGLSYMGTKTVTGIGVLCHEFSHCLGLPDTYDVNYGGNYGMNSWDLMDAGSYNDKDGTVGLGFCPPAYSAWQKVYCGWTTPVELSKPTTVKNLPAQASKYGQIYAIYNDSERNEYYLLENRSNQNGDWDRSLAGSGLMIQYVDFNPDVWQYNVVNTTTGNLAAYLNHTYQSMTLFHADNVASRSTNSGDLYPYNGNNCLTDTSTPAAVIHHGGSFMGKPITNITLNDDGTVSFDFMGGSASNVVDGIRMVNSAAAGQNTKVYSIDGRYLGNSLEALGRGVYIVNGKKVIR